MPGQSNPNRNRSSNNGAVLGTVAAVGIGAIAAVGAYFLGRQHGEEETKSVACASRSHDMNSWGTRAGAGSTTPTTDNDSDLQKPDMEKDKKWEDERDCKICMRTFEEIKNGDEEIHTTQCGHVFCEKCINTCIRRIGECPICKHGLRPGETLRIYL